MSYTPTNNKLEINRHLDISIPTVRNLSEAYKTCKNYASVLTVGPRQAEVADFNHPDHKVISFSDTTNPNYSDSPTRERVLEAVSWGVGRENLLIHCHAGISRSTAIAWGVAIGNGMDEEIAISLLREAHPKESQFMRSSPYNRPFSPNELIVAHLEDIFRYKNNELLELLDTYKTRIW